MPVICNDIIKPISQSLFHKIQSESPEIININSSK